MALYFPDSSDVARSYEDACARQSVILSEIAIQIARGSRPFIDDSQSFQDMLSTGDVVTEKVLGEVGVLYKRRRPVVLPMNLD